MHVKTANIIAKTEQFIYLVKGTRVTRVKQQIFFVLILENTLIDVQFFAIIFAVFICITSSVRRILSSARRRHR